MAFPTIPTVAAGRLLTGFDTTPATSTFPSLSSLTKNSGDLLIAIIAVYQSTATAGAVFSNWGGGFTEFVDQRGGTTQMSIGAAYKWSTGSETGTFDVTVGATITGHAAMILMSIPGAHATTPPEGGAIAVGTSSAADPVSFNPTGWDAEDTLWISVGANGETALTGSYTGMGAAAGPPSNYTNAAATGESADVIGAVALAVAFRQLNAASEDVGPWSSIDTSNARNVALLLAVRPPVAAPQLVTPTTLALTTATFAPTVTATANQTVTPTTASLVTSTFAPTATASNHQSVTPTTASLTLTGFEPTVTAFQGTTATPGTASLTTAAFAPTISVTNHQMVTPTTASLSTATFAPTVSATNHQTVTPSTTAVSTSTFAPSVTTSDHKTVVPAPASLTLTAFIPGVGQPTSVQPTTASLTTATFAPSVTATTHQTVVPGPIGLTITTYAPDVTAIANVVVTPDPVALALTGFAPTVGIQTPGSITVTPALAPLVLTGYAPSVVSAFRGITATIQSSATYASLARSSSIGASVGSGSSINATLDD